MASDLKTQIAQCEQWIRDGRAELARAMLVTKVTRTRVPRPHAASVARVARRAGLPALGLRLLVRYVRPSSRSPSTASAEEKAEYAACLVRLGAPDEALELLATLDERALPGVLLYRSLALIAQWRYGETIAPLRKYIGAPGIGSYQRCVAKVNLAAALVFEREWTKALALTRELVHDTSLRKMPLLLANTLELSSEMFLVLRKWKEARDCLEKARALIGTSGTVHEFLVRKLEIALGYMRGKEPSLDELRRLAHGRRHWETLRECDRFEVLKTKSAKLAQYLYFGTPYRSFRERLVAELPFELDLPAEYAWQLGPGGRAGHVIQLLTGEARDPRGRQVGALRVGQLPHRLLITLASDFYRPFRTHTLHAQLHPGEYFNPFNSPGRIHQLVRMLRAWIEECKLPLEVHSLAGSYLLRATGPLTILMSQSESLGKWRGRELEELRKAWPESTFAVREVIETLGIARRTAQRLLQEAVDDGELERFGAKGYTRYRFVAKG